MAKHYKPKLVQLHELEGVDLSGKLAFMMPATPDDTNTIEGHRVFEVNRRFGGYTTSKILEGVSSGLEYVIVYEDIDDDET